VEIRQSVGRRLSGMPGEARLPTPDAGRSRNGAAGL